MKLLIILIFALFNAESALAICCPSPLGAGHRLCKDGTWTWSCCGKQSSKSTFIRPFYGCNIFCCSCSSGCRKGTYTQCIASCDVAYDSCTWGCTSPEQIPWCLQACEKSKKGCYTACTEG